VSIIGGIVLLVSAGLHFWLAMSFLGRQDVVRVAFLINLRINL
jgi:hypothetical protein